MNRTNGVLQNANTHGNGTMFAVGEGLAPPGGNVYYS